MMKSRVCSSLFSEMMKIIEVEILVEVVDVEVVAIVVVTNPDIQVYHSSSRFYCNIYEKMLS